MAAGIVKRVRSTDTMQHKHKHTTKIGEALRDRGRDDRVKATILVSNPSSIKQTIWQISGESMRAYIGRQGAQVKVIRVDEETKVKVGKMTMEQEVDRDLFKVKAGNRKSSW